MMLNKWECSHPGCTFHCVGTGGAIGLRAIGWFVSLSPHSYPLILCPAHREDIRPVPCKDLPGHGKDSHSMVHPLCHVCGVNSVTMLYQTGCVSVLWEPQR